MNQTQRTGRSPLRKTRFGILATKIKEEWRYQKKTIYWRLQRKPLNRDVVLILGCQRSGTTLLGRVFDRDIRTTVLQEESVLTGNDGFRLRLKPPSEVRQILDTFRTPLVAFKPLVESQHADRLLEEIPNSKAIWMFRRYRDTTSSSLKRFDNQVSHLRSIVEHETNNWRSERISDEVFAVVKKNYSIKMSRADAAALIWYVRNTLFFEIGLAHRNDTHLCCYEALVTEPEVELARIYDFLGYSQPYVNLIKEVDARSVGLGDDLIFSSEIEEICGRLERRLMDAYEACHAGHSGDGGSGGQTSIRVAQVIDHD